MAKQCEICGKTPVVGRQISHAQGGGFAFRPAPDERANAGDQFDEFKRLGQVIIRAGIEAFDAFIDLTARREEEDGRGVGAFAQLLKYAQPITPGQHDVQDDGIKRRGRSGSESVIAMMTNVHGEAFRLQRLADEGSGFFLVFNNQYAHDHRLK